ncbi:hypothetical protein C6T53_00950 [Burkholderia multivorans]|nr:hypothetical protein C6T53_00950 [Burkholderia multivorans]
MDRNVVRLSAPPARRVPQMPKFDAPNDLELRTLWRTHRDPEIRRLILEIVTLRKSLLDILERWESINRETADLGDLGGPFGHWRKLYFAVRDHLRRAGLM